MFSKQIWILGVVVLIASGSELPAVLITNGDFSAGLTGYTTVGPVSTATSFVDTTPPGGGGGPPWIGGTILPTSGSQVSQLATGGAAYAATIESTLGLGAGSLQALSDSLTHPGNGHFTVRNGSAMQTTFSVTATGTTGLSFDWNFWTDDYSQSNDFSFFTISGPGITGTQIVLLADVNGSAESLATTTARGAGGGTGWQGYSYTLPSTGTYTIGFGMINGRNQNVPSYLHIDNIQTSALVPEASQALTAALLFAGGMGLSLRRRRPLV